jgi:competence ComEA-like helix-hairpin-helix protein
MFRTKHLYVLVFSAIACLSTSDARAQDGGQPLPEGKGKAEFERICSQCHAVTVATKLRMNEDGWTGVVNDMVSRGAQGTDDEFDRVVRYLTAHFGPDNPGGESKKSAPSKVNVNKASEADLSTTLGLSTADAQAIVHYRESSGEFKDWHDLEKVPHIDMKKLAEQKDRIEFSKAEK